MKIKQGLALVAALLVGAATPYCVQAADADPGVFVTANDTWSFEVVPYAWLAGLKGDINIGNRSASIDQDFSDIFKAIKIAADGLFIARYNDWLIYTQVDFFNLNTSQLSNGPERGDLGSKQLFYTGAFGYRFNGWASGQTFDVLLGAQGIRIENTLTLFNVGSASHTNNVVDAVFILRPSFQFSQHWLFNPTLSVGGGDSNSTYQLQPQFQYQFNSTWELRFGYRKMHYKFTGNNDNNTLNLNLGGPLIGFGATF
jgi:hypothetical protein